MNSDLTVLRHDSWLTDWEENAGQHTPFFMCISDVNASVLCPNEGFVLSCHTDFGITISTVKTGQLTSSSHQQAPYSDSYSCVDASYGKVAYDDAVPRQVIGVTVSEI